MPTKRNSRISTAVAVLLLAMLSACASNSPTMPPVIGTKPQVTALPASVLRIDPQSSQEWLREVENYLSEVDSLLSSETLK